MAVSTENLIQPGPICVSVAGVEIAELLTKEWLIGNSLGAYSSSTAVGCNTRRYHGLLVAAANPPVGRISAVSTVMERVTIGDTSFELATNEFPDAFSPFGVAYLKEFRNEAAATFVFQLGRATFTKEIILADDANVAAVRYTLRGDSGALELRPFLALRDYHALRKVSQPHQMEHHTTADGVVVANGLAPEHTVHLTSSLGTFAPAGQWWYGFRYRVDIQRGQEGLEDLYTPGVFRDALREGRSHEFVAAFGGPGALDFADQVARRSARLASLRAAAGDEGDEFTCKLAEATDVFVARRDVPDQGPSATILAGFPWFTDWGRDAFVALPGLLLATKRFDLARQVFRTFAAYLSEGMIPNRLDDRSHEAHYNSIDASLWYIVAAERYLAATKDKAFWRDVLMPTSDTILRVHRTGTRFDIHADTDGLLAGGSGQTQLTWMDAALGDEVVTPRHGKAVEVNALWHSAHRIMAKRCVGLDNSLAGAYSDIARSIADSFNRKFWNAEARCLYDCIRSDGVDAAVRANQILAVSLPHSPLAAERRRCVVRVVIDRLLTPRGLRTLSAEDAGYRGRYGGSWESRDRAYHQGTVWAWLIGPLVEAYLKTENAKPFAVAQAAGWLDGFAEHLTEAGLGSVSEIFDGDPPHTPGGCFAHAWSVAELLRARQLVRHCRETGQPPE